MKPAAVLFLLAAAVPAPEIRHFQYQRQVDPGVQSPKQSCLAIDPAIFPQGSEQLADLRLYRDGVETPYVLRTSTATRQDEQTVAPVNLGLQNGTVVFDADMPSGNYSDVSLNVSAQDFIATVEVSSVAKTGASPTSLGEFTIFDFTRQKLGRSTVLHLPFSNFLHLHFRIRGPLHPDEIATIAVARVKSSPPAYVTVAQTSQVSQKGRGTFFEISLPANVPVDRITFVPGAQPISFSRLATVRVVEIPAHPTTDSEPPQPRIFGGSLLRLHSSQEGHRIDEERLAIDIAAQASTEPTKWIVAIGNGDDAPVQFSSVRLEALERDLCFDAAPPAHYVLYYGDPALASPHYDYGDLFELQSAAGHATTGPEQTNPRYEPRKDDLPFTEQHPVLLWLALMLVILALAAIALRSAKRQLPPQA
jgi:hypothetical protein